MIKSNNTKQRPKKDGKRRGRERERDQSKRELCQVAILLPFGNSIIVTVIVIKFSVYKYINFNFAYLIVN